MARDEIKYHAPSSEFSDADLQTLGDACNALSFELRLINQPKRTPEERAALVARAAGLLAHASRAITPKPMMPGSPEYRVGNEPAAISQAFGNWMLQLQRTSRYHAMRRAGQFVFGPDGAPWSGGSQAADSNEATMEALRKLDEIHCKK